MAQQLYEPRPAGVLPLRVNPVELSILLRRHLLDFGECEQHAGDQYQRPAVETPDHRWRYLSLGGGVGDAYPGEEYREKVAHEAAGVAQQGLYRVRLSLLGFAHHVSHHHLERLHRDIDGSVEENQGEKPEPHRPVESEEQTGREIEAPGVRQQRHHGYGRHRPCEKIRLAPAHPAPCPVGPLAYQRLDDHPHQRGQYPEEAELVRIRSEGGEDSAYVGALECVGYLDPEKAEAQIPHLPETQFMLLHQL